MKSFIVSLYGLAVSLGGPGLFVIAFLDSSFVPLPQINDVLVVLMVIEHKAWMPLYAGMATLGSVAGCYLLYYLAEKGGEAFLRKRLKAGHIDQALSWYRRYGVLTLIVPALLPPPAPFKLFVLMAGVAGVRPVPFVVAVSLARGARYFALGILAVLYGDLAMAVMRTRGRQVALWAVTLIVVAVLGWVLWKRRRSDVLA
ncbi:MAG: VTT domain-containing protein [Vicinamibacterales bacterium]